MSAWVPPTEAEQNRLIVDHMGMVAPIAWGYVGSKGLELEELVSEGMVGLVAAARSWEGRAQFKTYAYTKVRGAILDFIKLQREFVPFSGDETQEQLLLTDWLGGAVLEGWTTLPMTPEKIADHFETIRFSPKLKDAWQVLSRREERMAKRFLTRKVKMTLAQVAREERMSYRKAVLITMNSVRRLRAQIKSSQQSANDRFSVANITEGIDVPLLPSTVNIQVQPATGGGKCMRVTSIQDQAEF